MTSTTAAAPAGRAGRPPAGADLAIGLGVIALLCLALIPLEIHRAFGLPAHPLILHVPVILVPILALALLFAAIRPAFFGRYALAIGALSVISMAATILTVGAGEAFRDDRGPKMGAEGARLDEHAQSGETLRLIMIALTAVVVVAVALNHAHKGSRLGWLSGLASIAGLRIAIRALFVVGAVAAAFFVIRTGHLGAKLTWGDEGKEGGRPPAGAPQQPGRGDGDGG